MDVKTFRDNLFSMNTRRFGRVGEVIMQKLINAGNGLNIHHDLYEGVRVEVKFSRVEKRHNESIGEDNVLDVIECEGLSVRMFPFSEWRQHDFDCNIQQIKKAEFDVLFYGLLFADRIIIFMTTPEDIDERMKYSDKQHKGNVGEGQFHINPKTLQYHLDNHLFATFSYADILHILN
jgi:hypothetical protein